jgi:hypothetical protein
MSKTRKERTQELLKLAKQQPTNNLGLASLLFMIIVGGLSISVLKMIQMLYTTGIIVK